VRGLRPARAGRFLTPKLPNPRSSMRSPRAIAAVSLAEDDMHDLLDVALIEMQVLRRDALHESRI
jgi:hypothetical protein